MTIYQSFKSNVSYIIDETHTIGAFLLTITFLNIPFSLFMSNFSELSFSKSNFRFLFSYILHYSMLDKPSS
jgi:hypothetical protein